MEFNENDFYYDVDNGQIVKCFDIDVPKIFLIDGKPIETLDEQKKLIKYLLEIGMLNKEEFIKTQMKHENYELIKFVNE